MNTGIKLLLDNCTKATKVPGTFRVIALLDTVLFGYLLADKFNSIGLLGYFALSYIIMIHTISHILIIHTIKIIIHML